jgi:hypothetical protein
MITVPRITGRTLPDGPEVGIEFGVDPRGLPSPFAAQPIPDEYAVLIAQAVVTWARFENAMNRMLEALLRSNSCNVLRPGWDKTPFDERRRVMRKEASRAFEQNPTITAYFDGLLDEAGELQIKRNILLHGHLVFRIQAISIDEGKYRTKVTIIASGRQKRQDYELHFDYETLDKLFLSLGHLCSRMEPPFNTIPGASSSDKAALEKLLEVYYPRNT